MRRDLELLWRSFATEEAAFKTLMANYQKTYPDIKVNQTYVAIDGYDQKVDLLTAGGQTPAVWDALEQRGVRYYAAKNQVVPLDDYVGKLFNTDDYRPSYLELQKWNGKLVALPNEVLTSALSTTRRCSTRPASGSDEGLVGHLVEHEQVPRRRQGTDRRQRPVRFVCQLPASDSAVNPGTFSMCIRTASLS